MKKNVFATAALLAAIASPAAAQQVTLKMHHFVPPKAPPSSRFMMPWSEKVEKASGGKIKIDLYPTMQLGGRPPQLVDQVKDGVVDLTFTLPGYTADRFPRTEVFEVPFLHTHAGATAQALQDYYDKYLKEEYSAYKVILLYTHDGAVVSASKPIRSLKDFQGLKIRTANRGGSVFLRGVGATAVGSPVTEIQTMLTKGVIDGVLLPYEIMPAFKIHELVHNHITLAGPQPRIGTSVFAVLMNKKRYDSLDAGLKKAIDDNSGRHIAKWAGETWEEVEKPGQAMAKKAGNKFMQIPAAEVAKIRKAVQPEIDKFLAELSTGGFDAKKAYADAQKMVAKYSKK
ncbi:MAG: TRAP transporter substrate-binding protein [Burkholderiales bacterium]